MTNKLRTRPTWWAVNGPERQIVIDPGRDVEPYLKVAASQGMRVTGAAETHIHADFVSGARELADRVDAKLYLSDEGPDEWKYQFAGGCRSQLLKHGDEFHLGKIRFEVLATPGHTPESISFLLTDGGAGATEPMGIFTGDFVFVGSIGRPDLLETAAGIAGSAEEGARQLFRSIELFRELPDHLQVWPAHGAGSACGKGLGAIPSSTVGYEKRFNPSLGIDDEEKFVDYILADQPETPFYFAVMKRVNKLGPTLVRDLRPVHSLDSQRLQQAVRSAMVIDTRTSAEFANGHVSGTINLPSELLERWAGYLVDYDQPLYLLTSSDSLDSDLKSLRSIGIDDVHGYFDVNSAPVQALQLERYASVPPDKLKPRIDSGEVLLLDVRSASEFSDQHIPGAEHRFLGTLLREIGEIDRSKPIVTQCTLGGRSAIAASLLQHSGFDVIDLKGGIHAWIEAGFTTQQQSLHASEA
jgi:hydroxyacylglutathione hydrolase